MRTPKMLGMALALGVVACSKPFPCTRYCWSHKQTVPDVTDEDMGAPDGRFDVPCNTSFGLDDWYPPLPQFGWYAAELCVEADVHEVIAKMVASIQDPAVDASEACDVTDLEVYEGFVEALALQARDACIAHVTCNGAPAGCDLDFDMDGNQACTVASAEMLCNQVVLAPALAALSDLSNGPGAAQPQRDGTELVYVKDPGDCTPLLQGDTDDTPTCPETPGGDGLDDSTSGGEGFGPFGDIDALVACSNANVCTVEPELFANVEHRFDVFHDDGVWLEPMSVPGHGRGLQLTGLERGEPSEALTSALGLEDGDVITHVDGASLALETTVEQLLLELPSAKAWRLTAARWNGSGWVKVERTIVRGS